MHFTSPVHKYGLSLDYDLINVSPWVSISVLLCLRHPIGDQNITHGGHPAVFLVISPLFSKPSFFAHRHLSILVASFPSHHARCSPLSS